MNMNYRYLGRSGVKVSELALGCMTFESGYSRNIDEKAAFAILDSYAGQGGNFFDMADNYPGVEELFGRWLRTRRDRDQFVIASKVRFPALKGGVNDVGLTRKHLLESIDATLAKTGAGYIDLYQAHCYDEYTPIAETLEVFADLIRAGKIRYAGASNFAGRHIAGAAAWHELRGLPHFQSYQIQYNLLTRTPEWEVIPAAAAAGSSVNVWSPLASGWLSGKYRPGEAPPADSRMARAAGNLDEWRELQAGDLSRQFPHPRAAAEAGEFERQEISAANEKKWRVIAAVEEVAARYGKSPSQVALAWLLARPRVCSVVMGVSKLSQLADNLGAMEFQIGPEETAWLDRVSAPRLVYPYDFLNDYGSWR